MFEKIKKVFNKNKKEDNKNIEIIGASGTGKSRAFITPNIMIDPKGYMTSSGVIFGTSGGGKSFSSKLASMREFEKQNGFNIINFNKYGFLITPFWIEDKIKELNCKEEEFLCFLEILNKGLKISPIGRNIKYNKNTFTMSNITITLKPFDKQDILNEIKDLFEDDLEIIFGDSKLTKEEQLNYIFDNYESFYDEELKVFNNYRYDIKKSNEPLVFDDDIFDNDMNYFVNYLKDILYYNTNVRSKDPFWEDVRLSLMKGLFYYYLKKDNYLSSYETILKLTKDKLEDIINNHSNKYFDAISRNIEVMLISVFLELNISMKELTKNNIYHKFFATKEELKQYEEIVNKYCN